MTEMIRLLTVMSVLNIKVKRLKANEVNAVKNLSHINLQITKLKDEGNVTLLKQYSDIKISLENLLNGIVSEYQVNEKKYYNVYNIIISKIASLSVEELLELQKHLGSEILTLDTFVEVLDSSNDEVSLQCYKKFYGANVLPINGEDFKEELLQDIANKREMYSSLSSYVNGIVLARGNQKK